MQDQRLKKNEIKVTKKAIFKPISLQLLATPKMFQPTTGAAARSVKGSLSAHTVGIGTSIQPIPLQYRYIGIYVCKGLLD